MRFNQKVHFGPISPSWFATYTERAMTSSNLQLCLFVQPLVGMQLACHCMMAVLLFQRGNSIVTLCRLMLPTSIGFQITVGSCGHVCILGMRVLFLCLWLYIILISAWSQHAACNGCSTWSPSLHMFIEGESGGVQTVHRLSSNQHISSFLIGRYLLQQPFGVAVLTVGVKQCRIGSVDARRADCPCCAYGGIGSRETGNEYCSKQVSSNASVFMRKGYDMI